PITLAALAIVTFGGPWSAYDVALASQRARLVRLLEKNGMWREGGVAPAPTALSIEARRELSSVLVYLLGTHGGAGVQPMLSAAVAAADSGITQPERESGQVRAQRVATRLGFGIVNTWEAQADSGRTFYWTLPWTESRRAAAIDGFGYHVHFESTITPFRAGARSLGL